MEETAYFLNLIVKHHRPVVRTAAARDVTKTNILRVETFRYLGFVDGDKIRFYRSPTRRHTTASEFDLTNLKEGATDGRNPLLLRPTQSHPDPGPSLKRSQRHRHGRNRCRPRPRPRKLRPPGLISADNLSPHKSRILLMLALIKTTNPAEIRPSSTRTKLDLPKQHPRSPQQQCS